MYASLNSNYCLNLLRLIIEIIPLWGAHTHTHTRTHTPSKVYAFAKTNAKRKQKMRNILRRRFDIRVFGWNFSSPFRTSHTYLMQQNKVLSAPLFIHSFTIRNNFTQCRQSIFIFKSIVFSLETNSSAKVFLLHIFFSFHRFTDEICAA